MGYWSGTADLVFCEVYIYITYRQLFSYGWWSTLWRLVVVVLTQIAVMIAAITLVVYFYFWDEEDRTAPDTIKATLFIFVAIVTFVSAILFIAHRINKRNSIKNP